MTMFDVTKLPGTYLEEYGAEKLAEILGQTEAKVKFWVHSEEFPLEALQKLLVFDPAPLAQMKPLYENPPAGTKVAILACSNRKPEPLTVASLFKLYDSRSMVYEPFGFNSLYHVRNMAAAWFLKSGLEWSFWSDDDSVHPCGDAAWFKRATGQPEMPDSYAGVHAINRLLATGKKIVGCSYVSRTGNATPQFSGGQSLEMSEQVRAGPRNHVLKRDWIGFGGALVHRDVFLDIIKTQTEEIRVRNDSIKARLGYEFSFFRPVEDDIGDDISFCARARKAGHEVFVDLAVASGHVGSKVYSYRDIRRK